MLKELDGIHRSTNKSQDKMKAEAVWATALTEEMNLIH